MQPSASNLSFLIVGSSLFALVFALLLARWVLAQSRGTDAMQRISNAIQEGAEAFLSRQYRTITVLALAVAALLYIGYAFLRTPNPNDPVQDPKVLALA